MTYLRRYAIKIVIVYIQEPYPLQMRPFSLPLMPVLQALHPTLVPSIKIATNPTVGIPLPPDLYKSSPFLLAPKSRPPNLEIRVPQIRTRALSLHIFHYAF
jgi:hypothetical protein